MLRSEIIPTPKQIEISEETVLLDASWGVADRSGIAGLAGVVAEELDIKLAQGEKNVALQADAALAEEEYRVEVAAAGATVAAASRRGFLHALSTLKQLCNGPLLNVARVHDYPRLPMRGMQLMFESFVQMNAKEALGLIESAGKLKLNTVLLEFGDRFPFEKHSAIRSPSSLSRTEVTQMVATCDALGIQPIPLLQSLGHLRYMLKHDEYADIREEHDKPDQMCPTNEKSFRMWTEMAEEVLELFPGCKLMHIGADETRQLGVCPRCKAQAEKTGKASLYLSHINKVCAWLADRGITPIIWDDILCAHPSIMGELHESAWIMYWDYWTTSSPSPIVVIRYDMHGLYYDKGWKDQWKHELSDATRTTLDFFGHPVAMGSEITPEVLRVYGKYFGDQLPKLVRAFPYLEYYQDQGRTVIGGPTCSGNTSDWHGLPDFPRYAANIKAFGDRCIEAKAQGLVTTAWYNRTPEILYQGLINTAQFSW
jgi:hypothetical protein